MKRWPKTAFVLAAAIGLAFLFLLPLLPFTGGGYGCVGGVNIGCAPDHASASFYLFGFGYLSGDLSTPHGASTYYSWCTANPGAGGFGCRNGAVQVPW